MMHPTILKNFNPEISTKKKKEGISFIDILAEREYDGKSNCDNFQIALSNHERKERNSSY